ncbi:putative cytochrome P450 [Dictyobacter vulcani]|uniref:Putative cytochrome P450 n=1 Tax=Dictyobacter vulcani TaxID=2607529 RepID=A0A5J4KMA6_9CHLR|nr:cytochrome P450 [Dictyobacter vulcani]GER90858.1 putative cytochrome P450 [Dictyobacter vulcani]
MSEIKQSEQVHPYEAIPYVQLPDDYQLHLGEILGEAYAQHGPIFRASFFDMQDIVYMVGPEANRFVLVSNRQKFSNYVGWGTIFGVVETFGRGLLSMDGAEHDQQRKVMNPAFTVSYMDRYLPLMNRVIREQVATWAERPEVNIYDEARKLTFEVAAETLTSLKPGAEVERFRELYMSLIDVPETIATNQEFQEHIKRTHHEIAQLLEPKIEERRQHPGDDVFSLLVNARDAQGNMMSNEQIIAHVNILLVAGHETSTSLSAWLLYLLTQHPEYTQRILTEQEQILGQKVDPGLDDLKRMKVLEYALSEAERLYAPVPNGPRGVTEDFVFNGYQVPAGSFLFYSIIGSHMLPHIFKDPATFDPDRFAAPREEHKKHPYALVGFGGGPRICIGINFAQIEIKAMVSHILRNYKLELVPDQHIVQVYGVTGQPMNGIYMRVSKL